MPIRKVCEIGCYCAQILQRFIVEGLIANENVDIEVGRVDPVRELVHCLIVVVLRLIKCILQIGGKKTISGGGR